MFDETKNNSTSISVAYGAKALVQDNQMLARRGHLVLLRRTHAKQFYFLSGGCANYRTMYVFCRHRDIVIGGSVQDGNESELANSDDDWVFRKIIEPSHRSTRPIPPGVMDIRWPDSTRHQQPEQDLRRPMGAILRPTA